MLTLQNELREPALGVGVDRQHGEIRRLIAVGIALHIGEVCGGGVLVALLADVQVAQALVQQVGIRRLAMPFQEGIDGSRPLSVGERDTHDPQRVFDELAIRALEAFDARRLAVTTDQRQIQNTGER